MIRIAEMTACANFVLILCLCVSNSIYASACHDRGHGANRRAKRQADGNTNNDYSYLREFFATCLLNKVGDIWSWQSVVDVSVLDSIWYNNSAGANCSNQDSVVCWQDRLNHYLTTSSSVRPATVQCINEYQQNISNIQTSALPTIRRSKRQTQTLSQQERCTDYQPNSPEVRAYGTCNTRSIDLGPARENIDFDSVFEFIAENTLCGAEFPDCGPNEVETISENNAVPRWPYRFEALMRTDTPVRASVFTCNNLIFPLVNTPDGQDPESRCSQWQSWSSCSCGGSRTKTRSRNCPTGTAPKTQDETACNTSECASQNDLSSTSGLLCNLIRTMMFFGNSTLLGGSGSQGGSDMLLLFLLC